MRVKQHHPHVCSCVGLVFGHNFSPLVGQRPHHAVEKLRRGGLEATPHNLPPHPKVSTYMFVCHMCVSYACIICVHHMCASYMCRYWKFFRRALRSHIEAEASDEDEVSVTPRKRGRDEKKKSKSPQVIVLLSSSEDEEKISSDSESAEDESDMEDPGTPPRGEHWKDRKGLSPAAKKKRMTETSDDEDHSAEVADEHGEGDEVADEHEEGDE